jgi:hypothetical protein
MRQEGQRCQVSVKLLLLRYALDIESVKTN